MQKRAADLEVRQARLREPVAVVSMACRLPGGIDSPEGFWELLACGGDAVGGLPERWRGLDLYDADPEAVGKSYAREGGFIEGVEGFDAAFFGISPREALSMDPQQRLVLEASWEALERAGVRPDSLGESRTGVYLGTMSSDYGDLGRDLDALDGYVSTGKASSVVSGRVSYTLGLQGPAITVDTACSSSLVAVHLAVQALRQGECELALAGGVTVMSAPSLFVEFSRLKGMAADGRCKSFSAAADGAGWAEGVGVLVLKRLSVAERDGDRVLAVIRGSAVNQDGRSQGLTAPNGPSQQRVIRDALAAARLVPGDIDAIEAHGTGTSLGDPIEAGALAEVFGPGRDAGAPVWLGSSKSNIGHAQAAAGVVGVIKMVLALQNGLLPRTLHVGEPSPHIQWDGSGLALLDEARTWERDAARPRRAGVSSFGLSGTNAHVVLEEAPVREPGLSGEVVGPVPVVVSGRDEAAVREQAGRWASWLSAREDVALADVAVTAARHRTHFESRASVVAADTATLVEALEALAEGRAHDAVVTGAAQRRGKVVFVYPGQGSQWVGMGRELLATSGVFRETVEACDAALRPFTGWSVREVLAGEEGEHPPFDRVDVVQPALFAMGVALSALWRSLGVEPAAVVGHSQGEVVAAVVSGALTLEQGAQIVAARSRAVLACAGQGGMALIERPVAQVEEFLAPYGEALSVAAVNTAGSTIISGEASAIGQIVTELQAKDVYARKINVDYASHNAQMDPLLPGLAAEFENLTPQTAQIPLYSTVTSEVATGIELDGGYWCRNLREPVRFDRALTKLLDDGHTVFVEISAHPVLSMPLTDGSAERGGIVVGSLARNHGTHAQLLRNLGLLHVQGHQLDWDKVLPTGSLLPLPTYAFQRERYWREATVPSGAGRRAGAGAGTVGHPWLRDATVLADGEGQVLTGGVSLAEDPWLKDHAVFDTVLLPGTGLLDLALAAARQAGAGTVEQLTLLEPLRLPGGDGDESGEVALQVIVGAADGGGARGVRIYSRREGAQTEWTEHASGTLGERQGSEPDPAAFAELRAWPVAGAERVELDEVYERFADGGIDYGPAFRGLTELWRKGDTAYGLVRLPEGMEPGGHGLHPALTDAALHTLAAVRGRDGADRATVALPFEWNGVEARAEAGGTLRVRLRLDADGTGAAVQVADGAGDPVGSVRRLRLREATAEQVRAEGPVDHLYQVVFQPLRAAGAASAGDDVWVLGGDGRLAEELGARVFAAGPDRLPELLERERPPRRLLVDATADAGPLETATRHLELLRSLLAESRLEKAELVWVTCRSTAAVDGDRVAGLAQAPLWGLLRTARSEHTERAVRLVDLGGTAADRAALGHALAAADEPEIALRDGGMLVPRLVRAAASAPSAPRAPRPLSAGRVLVTGGTGELGRTLAGHLVREHGVRHLVLTSRSGDAAPGAGELVGELTAAGAESVRLVACDVADRQQTEALLDSTDELPWTGVFHLAGVLDDGLLAGQDGARLSAVLAPKALGALHLHELTEDLDLAAFVLFSSVAGVFGSAGQSTYAAANTFLDALAAHRAAGGRAAVSLSWGLWQQQGIGMTARLGQAELSRMRRHGIAAMPARHALRLLDTALARPQAHLVPVRLEPGRLRRRADDRGALPPLLHRLVAPRPRTDGAGTPATLRERLATLPGPARQASLTRLAQREAGVVLGRTGQDAVGADLVLKDLGLDSLMAVELRRRLCAQTGLTLPATLAFDHPTCTAVAAFLDGLLFPSDSPEAGGAGAAAGGHARPGDDAVAVVSMACRLPGGIDTPEGFWDLLTAEHGDAVGDLPERWSHLDLYDPDPAATGKSYARTGGFLDGVEDFDAEFFGISPREAQAMDPQQRLVLETSWEALERAGIRPDTLRASRTGVYLGTMGSDYVRPGDDLDALDGYVGTGNAASVVSGRVSYALGLQGPAVTVDTACSSSLVALHLAAGALRSGECELAVAGGVTVMAGPSLFVEFSRLKGMAPDGRCKSFSAAADGAGWAEGAGVLVLKRLADAERDGDRVLAVIRGSAVNQDGRSQGLTAPNGPAQQRVIRDALAASRLTPADIDAVEAHGTGTPLGDPIEAGALAGVFGPERTAERPLWLGSSKSNIGHAQAAAGVVGVMKMILALQHDTLPRTLHADEPSPHIQWDGSGLELLHRPRPWHRDAGRPRRAGVSSFGLSGTNAHLVLEEAPPVPGPQEPGIPDTPATGLPLLLSGRDEAALRAQAGRWADWLAAGPRHALPGAAYTAAVRRTHFARRAVVHAQQPDRTVEGLRALAEGRPHPGVTVTGHTGGPLAVLFTGQGSQRPGMGRDLYGAFPAFAEALDEIDDHLAPLLGTSLTEVLWGEDAEVLERTEFAQPALFAVEVALFRLMESLGVRPDVVAGHSVGEIAAAHVAGMLDLADAARLVAVRGRLMQALPVGGAMVAVQATEDEVAARLADRTDQVGIAAVNGPSSVVMSGDKYAVLELAGMWQAEGRRVKRLRVSHAFHSPLMEPMLDEFRAELRRLPLRCPAPDAAEGAGTRPVFVSGVTPGVTDARDVACAEYWVRHARQAVRFADSVRHLEDLGTGMLLELGPDTVLAPLAEACLSGDRALGLASAMRRDRDEVRTLTDAVAAAHLFGTDVDWEAYFAALSARPEQPVPHTAGLPTYPFQRRRFWTEAARAPRTAAPAGVRATGHPLLGAAVELPEGRGLVMTGRLSLADQPWLADHTVAGAVLFPGTGFVELVGRAGERLGCGVVEELTLQAPLVLPERGAVVVQVVADAEDEGARRAVSVYARAEDAGADVGAVEWSLHARGVLAPADDTGIAVPAAGDTAWPPPYARPLDVDGFYTTLGDGDGVVYGPRFRGLRGAWSAGAELYAEVALPDDGLTDPESYGLHPALFDACLHVLGLGDATPAADATDVALPFSWSGVRVVRGGCRVVRVRVVPVGEGAVSLTVTDEAGALVASVGSLVLRAVSVGQLAGVRGVHESLFRVEWERVANAAVAGPVDVPDGVRVVRVG
ncbi:type I polyketide synthase, partial [Streptomyces sp. NPDC093094]|uniref:type I polyketide synthase n=1 Tax=Streptomyces sp. NPDC093094 TaxID=3366026 RepID=UPI0037F52D8C